MYLALGMTQAREQATSPRRVKAQETKTLFWQGRKVHPLRGEGEAEILQNSM